MKRPLIRLALRGVELSNKRNAPSRISVETRAQQISIGIKIVSSTSTVLLLLASTGGSLNWQKITPNRPRLSLPFTM